MKTQLITLTDLPGRRGLTRAALFSSVTAALRLIRRHHAVTAADDEGAINVWRDRKGALRAERSAWCSVRATFNGTTVSELKAWLLEHLPLISRNAQP